MLQMMIKTLMRSGLVWMRSVPQSGRPSSVHRLFARFRRALTLMLCVGALSVMLMPPAHAQEPGRPGRPTVAVVSNTSLSVSWTTPTNTGPAITGYNLRYRSRTGAFTDNPMVTFPATTTSTTVNTCLSPGTLYRFQVQAINSEGGSQWSPNGNGTTTGTNSAPTFTEGSTATRSINERHSSSLIDGEGSARRGDVVGARVVATDSDAGSCLTYSLSGTNAANFTIIPSTGQIWSRNDPTLYDYEDSTKRSQSVTVTVSDGAATDTIAVTINIANVREIPNAPWGPSLTSGDDSTSLTISWSQSPGSGYPPDTGYDVRYRQGGDHWPWDRPDDGKWINISPGGTGTSTTVTGLMAGTVYQAQVRSKNAEGRSVWSISGVGTTSGAKPGGSVSGRNSPTPGNNSGNSGNSGRSVGGGNNPGANNVPSGGLVGGNNDLDTNNDNVPSGDPVDENDNPPLQTSNNVSSNDGSISGNFVPQEDGGRVKIGLDTPPDDNRVTVSGAADDPDPDGGLANMEQLDSGTLPGDIDLDANAMPSGIWADDGNLWVISDWLAGELQVYSLADGSRQTDLGFGLDAGHVYPAALWSDGATLWVADFQAGVFAYRLADGVRMPVQDFDKTVMLAAGNIAPSGLWSDGKVIWVADFLASRAFAYLLSDKSRLHESDLDLTGADGEPLYPMGLTSDGQTVLTSSWASGEMHGFDLSSGTRLPVHDIDAQTPGIRNLMGLSFDGRTLYVLDELAKRVQAIFPGSR